ncbi:MAG: acyl transferase, partial [Bacteroidota bacterium]
IDPTEVHAIEDIPFLPISLFKRFDIQTGEWIPDRLFTSSGTTAQTTSRHLLKDPNAYCKGAALIFEQFYGPLSKYCFLALLPAYLERQGSSLVFMADHFIQSSNYDLSGFFLNNTDQLLAHLEQCRDQNIPTILLGVTFALLDLAEQFAPNLKHCIIMETGGMKGRRKEMIRKEVHQVLCNAFQVDSIHSEYGMTELFSQAYSKGEGIFWPGTTMKLIARDVTDPFHLLPPKRSGALNIIDLANIDTCSFIATDDIGRCYANGSFEVLGRLDNSDRRGCNLLVF